MRKLILFHFSTVILLAFVSWAPVASAFETYSVNGSGNCVTCHGDFRSSPYISPTDGSSWGDDLHDVHRILMLNRDCNTCHGPTRSIVNLSVSSGGAGLPPLSCSGCHGRTEDATSGGGMGAGLRQHHNGAGITTCADCHNDTDPATFTTAGENTAPPYYFTPDATHPTKPTDACSPNGEENYAGSTTGLDNDGDGLYDQSDPDCLAGPVDGDLNNDGAVDNADFNIFIAAFGTCEGDGTYNADANYDGDTCITFVDYQHWFGFYLAAL